MSDEYSDLAKFREFARNQAARASEYAMRAKFLEKENARLRRRLAKVHRSWTWRIGRVVLFPYHAVIWLLDQARARRSPS